MGKKRKQQQALNIKLFFFFLSDKWCVFPSGFVRLSKFQQEKHFQKYLCLRNSSITMRPWHTLPRETECPISGSVQDQVQAWSSGRCPYLWLGTSLSSLRSIPTQATVWFYSVNLYYYLSAWCWFAWLVLETKEVPKGVWLVTWAKLTVEQSWITPSRSSFLSRVRLLALLGVDPMVCVSKFSGADRLQGVWVTELKLQTAQREMIISLQRLLFHLFVHGLHLP